MMALLPCRGHVSRAASSAAVFRKLQRGSSQGGQRTAFGGSRYGRQLGGAVEGGATVGVSSSSSSSSGSRSRAATPITSVIGALDGARQPQQRRCSQHRRSLSTGRSGGGEGDDAGRGRTLLLSRDDASGIVTVAPNRPEKRNAINRAMWDEVGTVMQALDQDDSVRCIVLRINGPGADISEFATQRADVEQVGELRKKREALLYGAQTLLIFNTASPGRIDRTWLP